MHTNALRHTDMCINMLHRYHQKKCITPVMGKSHHAVRNYITQLTNTLQNVSQKD